MRREYPVIKAQDQDMSIIAVYALNKIIKMDKSRRHIKLINATHAPVLYLQWEETCSVELAIRDTCGNKVHEECTTWHPGVTICSIPCSGLAELKVIV